MPGFDWRRVFDEKLLVQPMKGQQIEPSSSVKQFAENSFAEIVVGY